MAQTSLNSTGVASSGALSLQSNGTTEAIGISTGQVATLAQNPILTSGTANGVAYLNGSKVVTSGSALVFDGTNLGVGVTPSAWVNTKAIDVGQFGSFSVDTATTGATSLSYNAYAVSATSWKYKVSSVPATRYNQDSSGTHQWYTAASGTAGNAITFTQAMTLDASGNLGVGTSSPSANSPVHINKATAADCYFRSSNSLATSVYGTSAGGESYVYNSAAYPITFYTNATERARIDSSGNLLVGTTSSYGGSTKFSLAGNAIFNAGTNGSYIGFSDGTSGNEVYIGSYKNLYGSGNSYDGLYFTSKLGARSYVITNNSGVYLASGGTSWTAVSDERQKDIIEPITNAANKVSTLRTVIGKYKTDAEGTRRSFLIAQDVQAVMPEAVDASNPDELGVQYTDVIPLLVAAIKEQQAMIASQSELITQLQADVAALKA